MKKLKLEYEFEVASTSTSPYESGFLELQIRESGLSIRWSGEQEWKCIEWHEVAFCANAKSPKLCEELEWIKGEAYKEGFDAGAEAGLEQAQRKGEVENIRAASDRLRMAFRHRFDQNNPTAQNK